LLLVDYGPVAGLTANLRHSPRHPSSEIELLTGGTCGKAHNDALGTARLTLGMVV
jgi:hypothetical protein